MVSRISSLFKKLTGTGTSATATATQPKDADDCVSPGIGPESQAKR